METAWRLCTCGLLALLAVSHAQTRTVNVSCLGGFRGSVPVPAIVLGCIVRQRFLFRSLTLPSLPSPPRPSSRASHHTSYPLESTHCHGCDPPAAAVCSLPAAMESGVIVGLMPPDAPVPTGGYATPALGRDGLRIGDTVGRTPGAYSSFISCHLQVVRGWVRRPGGYLACK